MTVRKFRDAAEMNQTTWYEPGSPEHLRALRAIWTWATRTGLTAFPPGVHRYRSFEDMQRQAEAWREASFRARQARIEAATGSPAEP